MSDISPQNTAEILSRLVGFPSVVGTANDRIVEYVRDYLSGHGVTAHVLTGPEGDRSNLFATIGPANVSGYVLSGHLDVVPAADQSGWLADPFDLRARGDRLIGRGAVDMKGFVAAVLACVPALTRMDLTTPIHIALSYDEEAGCRGVPHLIADLPDLCAAPLGCIIGEPTDMVPVLRHKGKSTLRLTATGIAGHSSRPDEGQNAIHMLLPALNAATELSKELKSGQQHKAFDPPVSTLQIGTVQGGTAVNIIPDQAQALIELRALPGLCPIVLLRPVIEAAEHAGLQPEIVAQYPGLDLSEASDLARLATRLSGHTPSPAVSFGTEAGLFGAAGYPAIVCGPGSIARAHRPEEYITTQELAEAARFVLSLAESVAR